MPLTLISKQHVFLGFQRPGKLLLRYLHSKKTTLFSGISLHGVIDAYIVEDENGNVLIANEESYLVKIQWLQLDGATVPVARAMQHASRMPCIQRN
jgi:hypothetical protein